MFMNQIKGNIVDVLNRRVFYGRISFKEGFILSLEELEGESDKYILPGLVDAHIHIESSMLIPSEFAKAAVRHGVVASVSDPHEIANVLGMNGIRFMLENGETVPFKFYFGAPSCVPATDFETSGGKIGVEEISILASDERILYLGEMMNFPGVIYKNPDVLEKLKLFQKAGKPIDGHAPGLKGDALNDYVRAGITTDHESFSLDEALEKINLGMKILIRNGSAAKNLKELASLIDMYPEMVMLCSDDLHPNDLVKGHINLLIKDAISYGAELFNVLRACTVNPKVHYGLKIGLLQTGDPADFVVVNNLSDFKVLSTYIDGIEVFDGKESKISSIKTLPQNQFISEKFNEEEFLVEYLGGKLRVIQIIPGEILTDSIEMCPNVQNGFLEAVTSRDILKLTVVNRYQKTNPAIGFIKGFGIKRGAVASSVAHDSHNIVCVGTNEKDICRAVNLCIENSGGLVVVDDNSEYILPLQFAGIMTDQNFELVAEKYELLESKIKTMGSSLESPLMTLSFMALVVIPKLKLSDKGLFDVDKFNFVQFQTLEATS